LAIALEQGIIHQARHERDSPGLINAEHPVLIRSSAILLAAVVLVSPARAQVPDTASAAIAGAQAAARSWLALVDRGQYGVSWDSAAAAFRHGVSKSAWGDAVRQARGALEPFGERNLTSAGYTTSLPNAPKGQYVVLQYETKVRGRKTVVETVTPAKDSDGVWRVSGYYVRPH